MDAVLITGSDGSINKANLAACDLFGMNEQEIINRGRKGLVDLTDARLDIFLKNRNQYGKNRGELRLIRYDGTKFEAEVSSAIYLDANGNQRTSMIIHDLTSQKDLFKLLAENEYRFRMALSNSPVVVFSCDLDLKYTWIFNQDRSLKESDVIGKTDFDIFDKKDAEILTNLKNEVLRSGIMRSEVVSLQINGSIQYIKLTIITQKDERANTIGLFCSGVNITNMKMAEERIILSENRFRSLVESSRSLIWETNIDGVYTYVSPIVDKLLGYEINEVIGKSPFDFSPESERDSNLFDSNHIVRSKKPFYSYINKMVKKDGKIIICDTSGTPVLDQSGNLIGYRGITSDISDRMEAYESLRASESRFKSLFYDNISVMLIIDPETAEILDANNAAVRFYGWSREQLLKMTMLDINTLTKEEISEKMNKALKRSQVHFEFKHRLANGEIRDVEVFSSVIIAGNKKYLYSIMHDITSKKESEAALTSNIERLKSLVNLINYRTDSIQEFLDYALNEAILLTSSKIGYIYFYDDIKQEFILNSWSREVMEECNIVNPQSCYELDKTGIWGEAVRQGKEIIMNDFQSYDPLKKGYPSGHVALKKYLTIPIFDDDKIVAVVGVANKESDYDESDIIQLKLLMNSVWGMVKRQEAEDRVRLLAQAIEQSPLSILITDNNGVIEYSNPKTIETSGFSHDEIIKSNPRIFKSGFHGNEFYKDMWEVLNSGKEWSGEILNKRKDGSVYWELYKISPMINSDGKITHFIGMKQDITDKKERIDELIKAKEIAEESERLKSFFLANISHELRTPMNGILGFVKLIKDSDDIEDVHDLAHYVNLSAERLLETLNLVIDLSRLEAGVTDLGIEKITPGFDLFEIVNGILSTAKQKNIEIIYENKIDQQDFCTSAIAIRNIATNLVKNAVKFTNAGNVKITLDIDSKDGRRDLVIIVSDTGIGISEKKLELVFKEFRQEDEGLNRNHEGLGLGLAISQKFASKLNGTIDVESKVNVGSTFTVRIPESEINIKNKSDVDEGTLNALEESEGKANVLVVDDNNITCKLVEKILQDTAIVSIASTPQEAMELANNHAFDLVLMDINLGTDTNGLDLTNKIRHLEGYETTPIIAMTVYSIYYDKNKISHYGLTDFIEKPFTKESLIELVLAYTSKAGLNNE